MEVILKATQMRISGTTKMMISLATGRTRREPYFSFFSTWEAFYLNTCDAAVAPLGDPSARVFEVFLTVSQSLAAKCGSGDFNRGELTSPRKVILISPVHIKFGLWGSS